MGLPAIDDPCCPVCDKNMQRREADGPSFWFSCPTCGTHTPPRPNLIGAQKAGRAWVSDMKAEARYKDPLKARYEIRDPQSN